MRDFRKLNIWIDAISLVKDTYQLIQKLPADEKFGLKSQISRAAVSIPSNIAEGCSRNSDLEFKRYLEIAMGSSFELGTQVILMKELNFITDLELKPFIEFLNKEQRMINSLISKLKATAKS